MLIILEGCDGTGKTTLANQLSKLLDAKIIHCSTTTPNTFDYFMDIVKAGETTHIIADRFCYGQFVYQDEYDRPLGHNGNSLDELHKLEAYMAKYPVKLVYVTAPADVIKDRLTLRKETVINNLSVDEVLARFEAVRKLSSLQWLEYNTGGENYV